MVSAVPAPATNSPNVKNGQRNRCVATVFFLRQHVFGE